MYFNEFFLDQVLTVNKIYATGLNMTFLEQMLIHVLLRFLEQLLHFKKNLCIRYLILKELDGCGHFDTCTILVSL